MAMFERPKSMPDRDVRDSAIRAKCPHLSADEEKRLIRQGEIDSFLYDQLKLSHSSSYLTLRTGDT
jgi:hypothetical protein